MRRGFVLCDRDIKESAPGLGDMTTFIANGASVFFVLEMADLETVSNRVTKFSMVHSRHMRHKRRSIGEHQVGMACECHKFLSSKSSILNANLMLANHRLSDVGPEKPPKCVIVSCLI